MAVRLTLPWDLALLQRGGWGGGWMSGEDTT